MANKPKARRRRANMANYIRGNVDEQLSLPTLGAKALVSVAFDETMIEKGRITSLLAAWSLANFTVALGDGPLMVGVAHSDYTDNEIEAFIEATGSWDKGDKIAQEIGRRLIRIIGVFRQEVNDVGQGSIVLNDGKPIKTRLNWPLVTGSTLKMWAYNMGTSALASTAPLLQCQGKVNIFLD